MPNPKSKILNPKQYPNPKSQIPKQFGIWRIGISDLFRIWDLEFRIYRERGISLIEVIVVIFVATVLLFSISQVAALSFRISSEKKLEYRAVLYVQEGIEAVRAMRDESWAAKIAPLTASTTYYFIPTANSWTLSTSDPGKLDGAFTRALVSQPMHRDASDNLVPAGTPGSVYDPDTKRVSVGVMWDAVGRTRNLSTDFYITNYRKN